MPAISAVINVKNNAIELRRCLKSLHFVAEIVVVDMQSDDDSITVAKEFGAKVFSHPDVGYADPARNFATDKASHDWVLVMDADEEVPATLATKIITTLENPTADVYWLPRVNILFGAWANYGGWWPDYQPRLFKKGRVEWQVGVHRLPTIKGTEAHFPATPESALLHHNYATVEQFVTKLNRYTSIQANERAANQPLPQHSAEVINQFKSELFRRLFHDQGLKGGVHGVGLAFLQSCYELVISMKMWELSQPKHDVQHPIQLRSSSTELDETLEALTDFDCELRYWIADAQVMRSSGLQKIYWQFRRKFRW